MTPTTKARSSSDTKGGQTAGHWLGAVVELKLPLLAGKIPALQYYQGQWGRTPWLFKPPPPRAGHHSRDPYISLWKVAPLE
jgi:hypothetical protein